MRTWAVLLLAASAATAADKELRFDSGEKAGHRSNAGAGHLVRFEAPRGRWWIRSVRVFGARYGGGYDPAATHLVVSICDPDLRPLARTQAPYELFAQGRFTWVEIPLDEPVVAPRRFRVIVDFRPARTRGVYLGWTKSDGTHSGWGRPGGREQPFDPAAEWMIRVRLTKKKPKPRPAPGPARHPASVYLRDFDHLARTVRTRFPALRKKGVDWRAACKQWRPRFKACPDDRTHLLDVHRLLALLGDMHTGVIESKVDVHVPAFDGLYGGGAWIAVEGERLVLRAWMDNHPLAGRVPRGSELVRIDGRPAREVLEETRRRLRTWAGWSSTHFLDARLSFQFFPFGEKRTLPVRFVRPDEEPVDVELERWGPGGRGLSRIEATMPEGVRAKGRAVSAKLDDRIGYLRILGGMDEATQREFFAAFDRLRGVEGIVLDCRGMGGGSDRPAWAMAGRFFSRRTRQGTAPALEPTGEWQFDGPVVLLQDERLVSSAETFVWAMVETSRARSVGRPTGGATIIPRVFDAPSGLFRYRLGICDRKTPIRGVQPEGVGTAPEVYVRYDAATLAEHRDPVLDAGLAELRRALERRR